MMRCKFGRWVEEDLDDDDREALELAAISMRRVDLFAAIGEVFDPVPFGLTTLKDHILCNCCCGKG